MTTHPRRISRPSRLSCSFAQYPVLPMQAIHAKKMLGGTARIRIPTHSHGDQFSLGSAC
jgi:hypothetical protein